MTFSTRRFLAIIQWTFWLLCPAGHYALAQPIGPQHHLTVCRSGELWGWGANDQGQLGSDPSGQPRIPQPQMIAGINYIVGVATADRSSYAITGRGDVFAWGDNSRGQLGVGVTGGSISAFLGLGLRNIISITAGTEHAIALRDDGTVWAWGANDQGQLGDRSRTDRDLPVAVIDASSGQPLTGIMAIASAGHHNLALSYSGQVYSWGSNANGEAGIGSTRSFFTEAQLLPALRGVFQIVAAETHCLALDQRGVVYSWGDNRFGQLGDGNSGTIESRPIRVRGLSTTGIYRLAATAHTSLALFYGGTTMVWGSNANGEFGVCGPQQELLPVRGYTFDDPATEIHGAGTVFTALVNGQVSTWGGPDYLGYTPAPDATTLTGGSCQPMGVETCQATSTQPVVCPPQAYNQRSGANYVAANHLPAGALPTDIGAYGTTTTIDARQFGYGGKVVFDGVYHVRGNVRLINGEFELRAGTEFIVDGVSGQTSAPSPGGSFVNYEYSRRTFIEVEDASVLMTGATLSANCDVIWGGLRLMNRGILRTEPDASVTPSRRCSIRDAFIGVEAVDMGGGTAGNGNARSTSEYYLTYTDFLNNSIGLADTFKGTAKANEGVHYCTFSTEGGTLKAPLNSLTQGFYFFGIYLQRSDQPFGSNNYSAASIDHCSFSSLYEGIFGVGQLLRIVDNTFDHIWYAAIDTDNASMYLSPESIERNTITVRGQNSKGSLTSYGILGDAFISSNYISGDDADPTTNAVQQVGISTGLPNGSTQTNNQLISLDHGIESNAIEWMSKTRDITGNLFRNVREGIYFYPNGNTNNIRMLDDQLTIRCNTFENPAGVPNAVGLKIDVRAPFPDRLGSSSNPNGNRFGIGGVLAVTPISNSSGRSFHYWAYSASQQEFFPPVVNGNYAIGFGSGNLTTACRNSYNYGINGRSTITTASNNLKELLDSLQIASIGPVHKNSFLARVVTATAHDGRYGDLEGYLENLHDDSGSIKGALVAWLMEVYRSKHLDADASRMSSFLLKQFPHDAEVQNFIQLSEVLSRIRSLAPLQKPSSADLRTIRSIANSGTASSFLACRAIRAFEPACSCHVTKSNNAPKQLLSKVSYTAGVQLGQAYPNPASNEVRLPYSFPKDQSKIACRLEMRDAVGRVVRQQLLTSGTGEAVLPVAELPGGLYTFVVISNGQIQAASRVAIVH